MFIPRIEKRSCAEAWLAASMEVDRQPGHESNQVVIDVEQPTSVTAADLAIIEAVDSYLLGQDEPRFPTQTVANTIFPQSTYERYGAPNFYDVYLEKVFPKLKQSPRDWGRYFERMVAHPSPAGAINNLSFMVDKMTRHVAGGQTYRNIYELPIYDPLRDAGGSPRGGQCLSYLSFKLTDDKRLLLCAIYRNHYYTEKLLGNLLGLGRLMAFVASEVKVVTGTLTIVSTHAEVDAAGGTRTSLSSLHKRCTDILAKKQ